MRKLKHSSTRYADIAMKTRSWQPVSKDGWIIKFSVYKETNVLLTIVSQYTGQVIIRHFTNEDDACMFINTIIALDAEINYEM